MRRLSTIGLAALLAIAPGFSGDAPAQGQGQGRVLAHQLITVADDFVVDVYHNGVKVPDDRRELVVEVHGATVERIKVDVRPGDWLVFNVVNNRMRWGRLLVLRRDRAGRLGRGVHDRAGFGAMVVLRRPRPGRPVHRRSGPIRRPSGPADREPLGDGDSLMTQHADGWKGRALWGGSRNTWIKFVAR